MADDVSAGRLHLDAYADTSGFARDAKVKVDAAVKNLRAKIKAELDTRGLVTQARESAKKAQQAATVRLKASLDTKGLVTEVRTAAANASKAAKVRIGAEIDKAKFAADLRTSVAAMDGKYRVSVGVDLDTAAARTQLAAFRAGERNIPITFGTKIDTGNLGQVISQFSMFPALAGGVFLIGSALAQVGAGLIAIVSSASQAVVGLAAIPNLLGAIGQGVAVLMAGFSGIGAGIKALQSQQKAAAKTTQQTGRTAVNTADAVAAAQQRVKDAYHQAADAARMSKYAVEDAEWNLARSQESVRKAQENLNQVREEAAQRIRDYNEALDRANLSEEQAVNRLQKAKAALQDVLWDPSATAQDRRDAELAVKDAEQDLREARSNQADVAKEAAEANAKGVEGADAVIAANEQVRDSNHALMLAERQLKEARHSAADSAAQSARAIADAQKAVAAAQKAGAASTGAMNAALTDQLADYNKLSPAAQAFAKFLFDVVMPRFATLRNNVQAALLPPLQEAITKGMPLIDTLEQGLVGTAGVIGGLALKLGDLFSTKTFNNDVAATMQSNNKALKDFGAAGISLVSILARIAKVAGPTLVEPFAKWTKNLLQGWEATLLTKEGTQGMENRFIKARETISLLASIVGNLAGALHGIGSAATPVGDDLLQMFDKVTQRWNEWTNSAEGQNKIAEYMEAIKPAFIEIADLIGHFTGLLTAMGEAGGGPVVGALTAINAALSGLTTVLNTPVIGEAVGWLLTLAGAAGGMGLMAGMVVKLGGGIALLAKISGLQALWAAFGNTAFAQMVRLNAQFALAAVRQAAVNVATKAWAISLKVLRGAMTLVGKAAKFMFGPWGLAILAVVATFVLLYKKVGWFRKAVDTVLKAVVTAFHWLVDAAQDLWQWIGVKVVPGIVSGFKWLWGVIKPIISLWISYVKMIASVYTWLWNNAVKPAFNGIVAAAQAAWSLIQPIFKLWWDGVQVLGSVYAWLWNNAVKPAMDGIGNVIGVAWDLIRGYFNAWRKAIETVGSVVGWLWDNAVKPAFNGIKNGISTAWETVIKPVLGFLRDRLGDVGAKATWLWNNAITPAWNGIKTAMSTVWNWVRDNVLQPMKKFFDTTIPNALDNFKTGVSTAWDKLRDAAKAPVRFVVDTIYNDGIRKMVNLLPGVPNLGEVKLGWARGTSAVLPGYTPGRDVHDFVSTDGRMRLGLSGGEGILRPEVVRALGPKAIDLMNGAARRGGKALRNLLIPGSGEEGYASGGIIGRGVRRTLAFWKGGVLPLAGASVSDHGLPYYGTGAVYAGDLNLPGYADYGKPIGAWKAGTVAGQHNLGDTSYGRYVQINHGGQSSLYAHMSKFANLVVGQAVRAGQTVGYVGDYGNTGTPPTSHLHFEIRGGSAPAGDSGATGGMSAADQAKVAEGTKKESSWKDAYNAIKNLVTGIPSKLKELAGMGPWGGMMRGGMKEMGGQLIQWINDKIPDEIKIPGPNIPLPKNPIPNVFDRGGDWRSGTMGVNLSGKTETVFTNQNILDLTHDLARISNSLRGQTTDAGTTGGSAPLVGEITLNARPGDNVSPLLGDLQHALRILSLGGVHAKHVAGTSV